MEFTLFYQGELRSNGDALHKQSIREALHPQMQKLWQLDPLVDCKSFVEYPHAAEADLCLLETVGGFVFAPLISDKLALTAQVTITMLRPERPGQVIQQSGDIDNRLKTLFDALSIPPHREHLPKNYSPRPDQVPLFCLLQDDRLISSVAVHTERLLTHDEAVNKSHVVLLIQVKTRVTRYIWHAIPFL
jgi:hypothetical protein